MRAKRVRDRTKLATATLNHLLELADDSLPASDTGFIEAVYQELYTRAEHACLRSDYVAAIKALEASSEHLARSKVLLGTLHENRLGMPANFNRALELYREAAAAGDFCASVKLGYLYLEGTAVPRDPLKAATYFESAAEKGDPIGQYAVAELYRTGDGVAVDLRRATDWLTQAAEQELPAAQYRLAMMYSEGVGVDRDHERAIHYLRRAAANGHVDAYGRLGGCFWSFAAVASLATEVATIAGASAVRSVLETFGYETIDAGNGRTI